ncbi:unnamed protein product [Gordionus sp. m RMFG-2023]
MFHYIDKRYLLFGIFLAICQMASVQSRLYLAPRIFTSNPYNIIGDEQALLSYLKKNPGILEKLMESKRFLGYASVNSGGERNKRYANDAGDHPTSLGRRSKLVLRQQMLPGGGTVNDVGNHDWVSMKGKMRRQKRFLGFQSKSLLRSYPDRFEDFDPMSDETFFTGKYYKYPYYGYNHSVKRIPFTHDFLGRLYLGPRISSNSPYNVLDEDESLLAYLESNPEILEELKEDKRFLGYASTGRREGRMANKRFLGASNIKRYKFPYYSYSNYIKRIPFTHDFLGKRFDMGGTKSNWYPSYVFKKLSTPDFLG